MEFENSKKDKDCANPKNTDKADTLDKADKVEKAGKTDKTDKADTADTADTVDKAQVSEDINDIHGFTAPAGGRSMEWREMDNPVSPGFQEIVPGDEMAPPPDRLSNTEPEITGVRSKYFTLLIK